MTNQAVMKRISFQKKAVKQQALSERIEAHPLMQESAPTAQKAVEPYSHTVFHAPNTTLDMLWQRENNAVTLTVPCASSWVDTEGDISRFLKEHLHQTDNIQVSFETKKITFRCPCAGGELPQETADKIEHLLGQACQYFDLLPTCMCCQRTISVTVEEYPDGLRTVCGICHDERKLQHDHERLVERQRTEAILEWKEERKKQQPMNALGKIGIWGGLWACGLGLVFFVLALWLDMFHYMPCFPGMVAGICVVSRLNEVPFYWKPLRFVVASVVAIVTITIVSCLLVVLFIALVPDYRSMGERLFADGFFFNLGMGIPGYLMGAFVASFFDD